MYTQPDGYILQIFTRGFHITAQIIVGSLTLGRLVVLNWTYLFIRYNTERRTRIICIRVKSGIFGQTAKFGQRPCLFPISIIGIKIN